jgi:hypothetical protein
MMPFKAMTFDDYLLSKKIDAVRFEQQEQLLFSDWRHLFGQMHPDSFTAQKKFLINKLRRKYLCSLSPT